MSTDMLMLLEQASQARERGLLAEACTLLADGLEQTPNAERLYLEFRRTVDTLVAEMRHTRQIDVDTLLMPRSLLQYLGVARHVDGVPVVWCPPATLDELIRKHPVKPPFVVDEALHWEPFHTDVKRDKFSIRAKRPTSPAAP